MVGIAKQIELKTQQALKVALQVSSIAKQADSPANKQISLNVALQVSSIAKQIELKTQQALKVAL